MSWIPALLLCLGFVFLLVELLIPGFGFFGITGGLLLVAGVIVRICQGLNLVQSLALGLMVVGVLFVGVVVMVISAKYGFLGRSGLFETRTTISKDYNKPDRELRKLVGKSGKAVTNLSLAGKAKINGKVWDVLSLNSFIQEGQHVKVVMIKDNQIIVRKWFE